MNDVCLLLIGDGRDDYRARTLESARAVGLSDQVAHVVEIDDCEHRLGFGGAVQAGWEAALDTGARWVFHLELDFTFNAPVDLAAMVRVLDEQPHLAQLVLKRQPCNDAERKAGGVVEQHPGDYTERTYGEHTWTEHRRFWSTNPSLYSATWCEGGWPQEQFSEGLFTHRLLALTPALRFAVWGGKFDPPLVHHIGDVRAGKGY
jgi:GT2 family glycosyltransferase